MDEIKDYPPYLDYPKPYKAQTNADRIRAMSDEELAKFLAVTAGDKIGGMAKFWLEWLQQTAEDDDHA